MKLEKKLSINFGRTHLQYLPQSLEYFAPAVSPTHDAQVRVRRGRRLPQRGCGTEAAISDARVRAISLRVASVVSLLTLIPNVLEVS